MVSILRFLCVFCFAVKELQPLQDVAPSQGPLSQVDKKAVMEKMFALLKSQGSNTVEGLIKFFKEKNLLDDSTEKIARTALSGAADPKNIDYAKFAEVCGTVAKEKGLDMEKITQNVASSLFGGITGAAAGQAAGGGSSNAPTTSATVSAATNPNPTTEVIAPAVIAPGGASITKKDQMHDHPETEQESGDTEESDYHDESEHHDESDDHEDSDHHEESDHHK